MQYQKDEIKNRIVVAALSEFKDKGYINASMRRISKSSNVPLGNLYRYFKNKEDLFTSIVGPVYINIRSFLNKIGDAKNDPNEERPSFTGGLSQFKEIDDIKDELLEICKDHNTELLILMDKSRSSPYENVKVELISVISDLFTKELLLTIKNKETLIIDAYFATVISASVVEGLCFILRKYTDGQILRQMTDQLLYVIYKDIRERLI